MSSSITIHDIDPDDESWLRDKARQTGVSMEEFVRRIIHEKRTKTEQRLKPSEAFAKYFGPERGIDLPPTPRYGHRPKQFFDTDTE